MSHDITDRKLKSLRERVSSLEQKLLRFDTHSGGLHDRWSNKFDEIEKAIATIKLDLKSFCKHADLQRAIREESTKRKGGIVVPGVNLFGELNPTFPKAPDVASTLSPQETALAEIADLRRRLDELTAERDRLKGAFECCERNDERAREAWRAETELRIETEQRVRRLADEVEALKTERDEWKQNLAWQRDELEAEVERLNGLAKVRRNCDELVVDDLVKQRDQWKERAEKAEAELESWKAELEDRMPAKWKKHFGDGVYALTAENWRNAFEEIEAIGHAVTKAREALAGESLEEVSS